MKRMLALITLVLAFGPPILASQAQSVLACEPPFEIRKCDINKDGYVGIDDIFIVARAFGTCESDKGWCEVRKCDLNKNEVIDMADIALVATNFGLQFYE